MKQEELYYGIEKIPHHQAESLGLGRVHQKEELKKNTYDIITDKIIELIESENDFPWRIPWTNNSQGDPNMPMNYSSKKNYSGINVFWLSILMALRNVQCPYFMTFNQMEAAKGTIKKGSKAYQVIYYCNDFYRSIIDNKTISKTKYDNLSDAQKATYSPSWTLKTYNVFNATDIENVDFDELWKAEKLPDSRQIENCENIIESMPNRPQLGYGGNKAFYRHGGEFDLVQMPSMEYFDKEQEYYSTFFHELVHSTGHPQRLERVKGKRFGDEIYALEELIAEMGAAYLCGQSGVLYFTINNTVAYLKSWKRGVTEMLKSDNKAIFGAASNAQRAADYILGKSDPLIYAKFNQNAIKVSIVQPAEGKADLNLIKIKIRQRQGLALLELINS